MRIFKYDILHTVKKAVQRTLLKSPGVSLAILVNIIELNRIQSCCLYMERNWRYTLWKYTKLR